MKTPTRRSRLLQFILLTLALNGCASAVDEGDTAPADEATASTSEALVKGAAASSSGTALGADAAGCDAAPALATAPADASYQEYASIVEAAPPGNTCTRVCACCKRGNRFCCAHCNFCTGPIKVGGGVLAQ